jgi:RES domain-containing protein
MAGGLLGAAILGGKWAPALAMVAFLTGEALIMLAVKEM